MKQVVLAIFISLFAFSTTQAIGLTEDPVIFKPGFKVKTMDSATGELTYGVEYPQDFDKTKKYPILLCLPGGDFSLKLASYYNWVYTPRTTFQDAIKIYPISNDENKILSLSNDDWVAYIEAIKKNENGSDDGWVISGASNGGLATFDIITASPETFRGFIVIPGRIGSQPLLDEWKNYDALIVYASEDTSWIKGSKETYDKLKGHVRAIELIEIEGEDHVLSVTYNIDPIYERFENLTP